MDKLIEENSFKQSLHNHTFKQPVSINAYSENRYPLENISQTISTPQSIPEQPIFIKPTQAASNILHNPQYGCLKNGQLPTYRNWFNRTQKATTNSVFGGGATNQHAVRANELSQKMEKSTLDKMLKKIGKGRNKNVLLEGPLK